MNNFVGTNADTAFCKTEKTRFQAFNFFFLPENNQYTWKSINYKVIFFCKKVKIEKISVTAFFLGAAEISICIYLFSV